MLVATQPKAKKGRKPIQIVACLRITLQGAEILDRRSEVINEPLAAEIQRGEQRKKMSDTTTAAIPEPAPAAEDLREGPIEPESQEMIAYEVSVVNSQRQWTAKCEEASCRYRIRNANWKSVGNGHWWKHNTAWSILSKYEAKNCCEVRTSCSHHATTSRRVS